MNIQYVRDKRWKPVAVQIPVEDREAIKQPAEEAEELDVAMNRLTDSETQWVDHAEARRILGGASAVGVGAQGGTEE